MIETLNIAKNQISGDFPDALGLLSKLGKFAYSIINHNISSNLRFYFIVTQIVFQFIVTKFLG